ALLPGRRHDELRREGGRAAQGHSDFGDAGARAADRLRAEAGPVRALGPGRDRAARDRVRTVLPHVHTEVCLTWVQTLLDRPAYSWGGAFTRRPTSFIA